MYVDSQSLKNSNQAVSARPAIGRAVPTQAGAALPQDAMIRR
jgi:hypothetical protein